MIISFDITRAFCILDNITIFLKRNEASFINATVYDVVAQVSALHLKTGGKKIWFFSTELFKVLIHATKQVREILNMPPRGL